MCSRKRSAIECKTMDSVWTHERFEELSWHDNHVHAMRITEGRHGAGALILDLDFILEWMKSPGGQFQFRLAPALLRFVEVTNLRISLDYATPTAALGPFSIHAIERTLEKRERYEAQLWTIDVNWPAGEIVFEANGFEQQLYGVPVISNEQCLKPHERRPEPPLCAP